MKPDTFPPLPLEPFMSYRGHLPEEPPAWTLDEMARFNYALAEAFGWKDTLWT